ncbi:transcriptional regulator [Spirochaetia bacterium]|nr:transcriptional regulator [Spirochaetia bacterium]GHV49292.1 transcriptional regulator [Spirochaetia bacterium]
MTSLRAVLAFNMKEQRHILRISQEKLAERVNTSTHYISMIEKERSFPTPEMLERIAAALEIDAPELFSTRAFPSEERGAAKKFQELVISDMEKVLAFRLKELEQDPKGFKPD